MFTRRETSTHRHQEDDVAAHVANAWGLRQEKFSGDLARVDRRLYLNDTMVAILEIKTRTNPRAHYPKYMIALSKWRAIIDEARLLGVVGVLVVAWTDSIGHIFPTPAIEIEMTVAIGGRTDRGDMTDIEPMIYIPVERFSTIIARNVGGAA